MENQVEETGMERLVRLRAEAKEMGIIGRMTADEFEAAIKEAKSPQAAVGIVEPAKTGLTVEEAAKIDARLKYEFEAQEKFKVERQRQIDRASIIAESELLKIPVSLSEHPTELELAKARTLLGIKKTEVKPSPETVGIEGGICPITGKIIPPSKRGYYIFTNREQDDAAHAPNLGGKYPLRLIPDQVHVLSEYHIRRWRKIAVTPVYERVPVPGPAVEGRMGEECKRTGSKPRFSFEYLGEAPQDAKFGLVTDTKILNELKQPL